MDRGAVIGLLATVGLLVGVVVAGAGAAAHAFWSTPSVLLVVGGAVLTTLVAFPATGVRSLGTVLRKALHARPRPLDDLIATMLALAEIARREGLLALDKPVGGLNDAFLRRAMQMAIDGYDPTTIQSVMQTEMEAIDLRHAQGKGMLEAMGRAAPVFGMIGTLIGLVIMLGQMNDPARIGPGMSVALLTTLYGLVMANVFCLPLARRLAQRSSEELLYKTMTLTGVIAIHAGDHPRVVVQKLRAYLPGDEASAEPVTPPARRPKDDGQRKQVVPEAPAAMTGADARRRFVDAA